MIKDRLTYVDTAKYLAIWMVVVSHCNTSSDLARFLFSFHVQLFFFLYGFVYKEKLKRVSVVSYFKEKIPKLFGRILVPYLLLAFILGSALGVKNLLFVGWGSLQTLSVVTSTHLWFLPCYFIAVILLGLLFDTLPKTVAFKFVRGGVILLLTIISAYLNLENELSFSLGDHRFFLTGLGESTPNTFYLGFPFALNIAFTGLSLIYIGYCTRFLYERICAHNWALALIATFSAVIGITLFLLNNGNERLITMSYAQYGNYLFFMGTSILLSISVLIVAKFIDNRLFANIGQYTLAIYGFHLAFISMVGKVVSCFIIIHNENIYAFVVGTATLVLCCVLIPVIRYIDPHLLGEK